MMAIMKRMAKRRSIAKLNRRPRRTPPNVQRLNDINYQCSPWGQLLVRLAQIDGGPSIDSRDGKLFRRRFRVPYGVFCNLVQKCLDKNLFGENASRDRDITGRTLCPVEIKLLSVLRILGRNWNFDDIAEATFMGESTARRAFHTFCENFVREYYSI